MSQNTTGDQPLTIKVGDPCQFDVDGGMKVHVMNAASSGGGQTDAEFAARLPLPVQGTFWPVTQPVSGTFWQSVQPVSGPATDAQLRATPLPVSGTLSVSNMVAQGITDAQIRATALPVVGSLGTATGKTVTMKTGNLVTTAVTADQVVLTYTVTSGKTFYMQYLLVSSRLTTFATTATFFGALSLENPAATKLITIDLVGAGGVTNPELEFAEPIPFAAGTVVRVVCTPSAVTSFTWKAAFGGYEK